jgi:hypothetical protein
MPSDVHFSTRNNAFEPERRVTLAKDGVLRIMDAKGETRLPLHEIGLIELSAESSLAYDMAFTCQIYKRRAWFPALTLKSKLFRGPNDFADQRTGYRQLMMSLHAQIVKNAWPVKTQIAARPSALMWGLYACAHWAVLIWIAVFMGAVLALAAFEHPLEAFIPQASFALATVSALAYLASKLSAIRATYGPWPYDPRAIPPALLPEALGPE